MCVWEESVNYSVASDGFFPFSFSLHRHFFSWLGSLFYSYAWVGCRLYCLYNHIVELSRKSRFHMKKF